MPSDPSHERAYEQFRRLAAQNPREAREWFEQLLAGDAAELERVLGWMAAPGEGRLRQLVANIARTRNDRSRFVEHFQRWLAVETDEFARRATFAALDGTASARARTSTQSRLVNHDLVEMYRYVSERLRHELQNALLGPKTRLIQLRTTLQRLDGGLTRSELEAIVVQLRDEFQSLGRIAEFEPNDDYFTLRPIGLCQWVREMNLEYARRYNRIDLVVVADEHVMQERVVASDYLLRLVFWNLWVNAHQAAGDPCSIRLIVTPEQDALSVIVTDNGKGFAPNLAGVAFQDRFSQSGPHRGRGLLEVQDAIAQLHGEAMLVQVQVNEYRVCLRFPKGTQ